MIITLKTADFSISNIGTLNSWNIVSSVGIGATYTGTNNVAANTPLHATVLLLDGYEIAPTGITVSMNGVQLPEAVTIDGQVITIYIASVTGTVYIDVPTVNVSGGATGVVLVNDFANASLGGGSYGAGGLMFGTQTKIAPNTFISRIDLIACAGSAYSNPTAPITTGEITIYEIGENGLIKSILAQVSSATSEESKTSETYGKHIYSIEVGKTVTDITNIGVKIVPADTSSAPTIVYAKGVSPNYGKCYMGAAKDVGNTISFTNANYYLPLIVYG